MEPIGRPDPAVTGPAGARSSRVGTLVPTLRALRVDPNAAIRTEWECADEVIDTCRALR